MVADEVAVSALCAMPETLAHGVCDERLHFGRGYPLHGSGTPRPPSRRGDER
jgi:hypothetical protein